MAGQGDKFGKEAPGSYTPGSAGQGAGRQSPEHEFVHQYCRLCTEEGKDNPYWYTSRSKLSNHATVCHRHWYSSRLDAFIPIADQEVQGKWGKVSKRQAHRRFRRDTTFAPGKQSEQVDESLALPLPGTPQFHSQGGFCARSSRWGWGPKFGTPSARHWIARGRPPNRSYGWGKERTNSGELPRASSRGSSFGCLADASRFFDRPHHRCD